LSKGLAIGAIVAIVIATLISICLAITSKNYFVIFSITLLPASALCFAVFYGMWVHNDYEMYERPKQPENGDKKTHIQKSIFDELTKEGCQSI
jgi:hypothetical protein